MKIHKTTSGRIVLFDDEMRLVEPVNLFLKMQSVRGRAPNTILAYAKDLKCYYTFLDYKHYSIEDFSYSILGEYVEYLESSAVDISALYTKSHRTPKTINRMLSTVSTFYKYLTQTGLIDSNKISGIVNSRLNGYKGMFYHTRRNPTVNKSLFRLKEPNYIPSLITENQIMALYKELPTKRDRILFKLLIQSGMRISEALSLKIQDIPIPDHNRQVAVLHNIKSKGKLRDIYVPESLVEELDEYILSERLNVNSSHDYLFTSQHPSYTNNHITYSGIYSVFKRAGQRAGFDFRFHNLRHTYISRLVESGMDVSVIRIIAGHVHLSTTEIYMTLSNDYITKSLEKYWFQKEMISFEQHT